MCWWPVAITHLVMSIWDSTFTRAAFEVAVLVSLAGPLFLYWVGFARMWMAADAFNEKPRDLLIEECLYVAPNGKCARWIGDNYNIGQQGKTPSTLSMWDPNKYQIFKDWRIWTSSLIYLVYSILSVFYVLLFAPKVLEWIRVTPITEPDMMDIVYGGIEPTMNPHDGLPPSNHTMTNSTTTPGTLAISF
jgi:hypothetical protein